jgi:alpha-beta hydrolase superfamily lysophospholipase
MKNSVTKRSMLLRLATWVIVLLAVVTAVWLIAECYNYLQSTPDRGWNFQVARIIGLLVTNLIFTVIIVSMVLLYLWVRMAESLPDLQGWHLDRPESEFTSADATEAYTLDDYLEQEERVFDELNAFVEGPWVRQSPIAYSRYHADSVCNPETIVERNWNRSLVLQASEPIGGVLLVHGLSDSPYSLRALGQRLHAEGYTVIWLRVPGHGTSPSALANVAWQDWTAAVKVAMRGLRERLPDGCPMFLAGYSNGGALSVHYVLSSLDDKSLPQVDGVLLFSPMIGINPMAKLTRLYHTVALVSQNKKAQWSGIEAEIDPFKFSSWPMNANVQAWSMTQVVEKKLAKLEKSGRMNEMPPVLAMQSVVDSTVVVPKLITVLFDRLTSDSSELFLFDINRVDWMGNLFNLSFEQKIVPTLKKSGSPCRLTILRNSSSDSQQLVVQTRDGDSWLEQETDMTWPAGVVSLSHVAIPFPPDDNLYGTSGKNKSGILLGTLSMRAEPSALMISKSLFVRCRSNPFYKFMEDRAVQWLVSTRRTSVENGPSRKF